MGLRRQRLGNLTYYGSLALAVSRHVNNWPALAVQALARRGQQLTVRFDHLTVSCPPSIFALHPVIEVIAADSYRLRSVTSPWKDLVARASVVVDIGAHVGSFSLAMCTLNPTVRCYCYEPATVAYGYLTRNVTQNGLDGRVVPVNAAVASEAGEIELWQDQRGGGQSSRYPATFHATGARPVQDREFSRLRVRVCALDAILSQFPTNVDVLKIDCEGSEYDLVLGSSAEALCNVKGVILEYHPVGDHQYPEIDQRLRSLGFALDNREERGQNFGVSWYSRAA